jgi:hypothetical protein
MSDEDLQRLAQGLPPVASGPALDAGTEGPAEMPGDRSALPVQPGDVQPPPVQVPPQGAAPVAAPEGVQDATVASPAAPAVPDGTHAVKGEQTTKSVIPSALTIQGEHGEVQALRDEQAAKDREAEIAQHQAEVQAQKAQAIAEQQRKDDADAAAEAQAEADRKAQVAKEHADEWAQLQQDAKQKPPMFGNWNALDTTLGVVSVFGALVSRDGGIGAAANQALGLIDSHVDRAYKQHMADIEERFKVLAEKDGYNDKLATQARLAAVDARAQQAQTYQHIGQFYDAQAAAIGTPAARAAAQAVHAQWDGKIAHIQAEAGKTQNVEVTTTTQFAPGKAGAGGPAGAGQGAVVNLVKMAEDGAPRSAIVAAAAKAGLPEKVWKNQVDAAFTEREKGVDRKAAAAAKIDEDNEHRAVRNSKGDVIGYAAGSRPDVKGIQDRIVNFESAEDFLKTLLREKKVLATGADWHNGVLAIAATTTANPSDSTTKHEAGTLTNSIGLVDQDAVKTKLADIQKRAAAFQKQLRPVEGTTAAAPTGGKADFKPRAPMMLKGVQYVEVGPDDWQPAK